MNFSDLAAKYGDNDNAIATALGTTRQLVRHWRFHGISPQRQAWIQVRTRGRLKVDPIKPEDEVAA